MLMLGCREKTGDYAIKARLLALKIMGAITESLGMGSKYLESKMEDGMQVIAVNCYPQCPEPNLTLGLPPHSDYSCITIVLHSSCGLEIMDFTDGTWRLVPNLHGALQVHVGDHVEVLSNGLYKSMVHRVTLNNEKTRVSIASLHSMGIDEKMATPEELISNEHPKKYKESSFRDFLNFLSNNDITDGKSFIEFLKINYESWQCDQTGLSNENAPVCMNKMGEDNSRDGDYLMKFKNVKKKRKTIENG
ncbi:hypothetical protein LXL04_035163 [Taraxacum kok-saghyz]